MLMFDSDQDYGPYQTLFREFEGCRVELAYLGNLEARDCTIRSAARAWVEVAWFVDEVEDEPSGGTDRIGYEHIVKLLVY